MSGRDGNEGIMTGRNASKGAAGAPVPPFNEDDLFDLQRRVSGAFACVCGLQLWMEVETLEPSALEPLAAILMPARDRLDELVKEAEGGVS